MLQTIQSYLPQILFALLSFSEILALIPGIKANSIFQLIVNFLKKFAEKK
jgi:hypothetical protein